MPVIASSLSALPRPGDEGGWAKAGSLTSVRCSHCSSLSPAWHLQYSRAGTSQCALRLNPIATCLFRAASQRVKLLVWHRLEQYWHDRLTFPTGRFDPAWVRAAAAQHARMATGVPAGQHLKLNLANPNALSTTNFTALGPQPVRMTGCSGCFNYTTTEGRVNAIAVDPTTTTNGSIVLIWGRSAAVCGKRRTAAATTTTWSVVTDDPLISTTAIDTVTIDPNNHNTVYAGTGDLNFGSFSMGSQGILKSTDAGATWTVLGATSSARFTMQPARTIPTIQRGWQSPRRPE